MIGGLHGATRHYFCPHCMTWMFTRPEGVDAFVNLRATMLDAHGWFVPLVEFWTSEGLPWAKTPAPHSFATEPADEDFPGFIEEYARAGSRPAQRCPGVTPPRLAARLAASPRPATGVSGMSTWRTPASQTRVERGVGHGGERADGAGLAAALHADRVGGRGHELGVEGHEGHVVRARHGVVHERAAKELALRRDRRPARSPPGRCPARRRRAPGPRRASG